MQELKERILKDGIAINEHVLKVDSFLNHQVDPALMQAIGEAFAEHFAASTEIERIDKVVTIESSGIAPAVFTALALHVPLVIFKKQASRILSADFYQTCVHSFTKDLDYELTVAKKYLQAKENILLIDDFLANGQAVLGVAKLCELAGANLLGAGIVIEKSFQTGRKLLKEREIPVYALAQIASLAPGHIEFLEDK